MIKNIDEIVDKVLPTLESLGQVNHYEFVNGVERDRELLRQALTEKKLVVPMSVESIKRIVIDKELMPSVCEDSGQAEWSDGESEKLAKAIHQAQFGGNK